MGCEGSDTRYMIWLSAIARSRAGRMLGLVVMAILAALGLRRSGYKAAKHDRAAADAKSSLDIRHRADAALRRAEGNNRPVDDRIAQHGRLRDE